MNRSIRVPAYAKINLCLHVLGKRADGYHELRTVFQTISLHDTLELRLESSGGIRLEIEERSLTASPALPTDSSNLAWRAIEAMRRELRLKSGVAAKLTKRIPVARGLGGGSSDAAAALIGMMRLAQRELPLARMIEIGSQLGADVPFFLFGGRALGISRGNEIYPLPDGPKRTILVVSPRDIGVSTREAYSWIDRGRRLTIPAEARRIFGFCALCWSRRETGVSNDFEAAVFRRHPRLARIRRVLLQGGAAEAALAGSGSAVFGVFRNPAQARRTAREFPKDQVFIGKTLTREDYRRALRWRGAS